MKTKTLSQSLMGISCALLLLVSASCDEILEAFNLESPFSTTFSINVEPDDELVFIDVKEIDLSSNEDFENNKDLIESFTVQRVYYKVTSYEGDAGIMGDGTATFLDGASVIGDPINQTNIQFNALYESGEEVDLPISTNTKNELAQVLMNTKKFSIQLAGTITDKPAYIDFEIFVVITAKVQPI